MTTSADPESALRDGMEGLIAVMKARKPAPPATHESTVLADGRMASEDDVLADAPWSAVRASTAGPARPLERGVLVGRYVVLQRLGSGAMGVVYAAYDPELDRKVALKLLLPGAGGDSGSTRLLREAQTLAKLAHPNVVAIHDVGTIDDRVWLAMEFVQGQTLRQWLATPRSWRDVVEVMRSAGEGLAAAHAASLLHRDFKPDNVMIGDDGRVRVMDFGLARVRDDATLDPRASHVAPKLDTLALEVTRANETPGTPAYMPPEQFDGNELTAVADQFAFCVTLWEALCGERPFAGSSPQRILVEIVTGKLRSVPKDRRVPVWLLRTCERGLAAHPDRRWPSMHALLAALADDPSQRRRRRITAAGVLMLVGLGVGAAALDQWARERSCIEAGAAIGEVWTDAAREAIEGGILAVDVPYAEDTRARVVAGLDGYAARWSEVRESTCRAHRVEDRHDKAMAARADACLDERRDAMAAWVELLPSADADTIAVLVDVTTKLPAIEPCADATSLIRGRSPPSAWPWPPPLPRRPRRSRSRSSPSRRRLPTRSSAASWSSRASTPRWSP